MNSRDTSVLLPLILVAALSSTANHPAAADDHILRLSVVDADTGEPLAARLYLRGEDDTWYYFRPADAGGHAARYEKQNWINAESTEYHTTMSAHPCETEIPPGKYELTVERGKSYFAQQRSITVDQSDVALTVELKRWNNPQSRGWYSGDTHLHRTIDELASVIEAEDLNVAVPLTNWVTIADTAPSAGNKNLGDIPSGLIRVDNEHVIWPRNTEYEIFSVGGKRHTLGALFVLGHREALPLGVPPWKPVIESVRRSDPGVLFDMDKLDWPFSMLLPTLVPDALYELSNNHVWRTEFAFRSWNTEAPPYMQPPYGRRVGGHRRWIDYTMGMYYTLLNCGFRMPPSAGSANGVHPVPAGFGRVYVHLPEGFDYLDWMIGLKQGRSFVTTGPMLYATADGQDAGHVFTQEDETISLSIELLSEQRLSYGELIVNGRPEQLLRPRGEKTPEGAFRSRLSVDVTPQRSGWFALRFWEPREDGQSRFVHSAPWYVEVGDEPVRISRPERDYLVGRMRDEIARSKDVVSAAAMKEYESALEFYQRLPLIDDSHQVDAVARPLPGPSSPAAGAWLDNMILDHRFSAHEVRLATGMEIEQAEAAIDARSGRTAPQGLRVKPYPGGRHPRIGFLDGAIHPQRETKVSVFPPWPDGGYVVIDVPEAIFSNLGLTYLAHTHIPTIWDDQSLSLEPLEWEKHENGLRMTRQLPNGIHFTSKASAADNGVAMQIELTNGTPEPLTGMRVQVCTMLKAAEGFNLQEPSQTIERGSFIAIKSATEPRWIITSWQPNHRAWTNPPVPCVHSDPIFPDCAPGETVSVAGGLWFYEGDQIEAELDRLNDENR